MRPRDLLLGPREVCLRNGGPYGGWILIPLLLLLTRCSSVPQPSASVEDSLNQPTSQTEEFGGTCPLDGWNSTFQDASRFYHSFSRTLKEVDGLELGQLLFRSRTSERRERHIIAVFFYEPTCPFSAQLRPIMEVTAKSFPSVAFVAVNGASEWKVVAKHFIRGFPSVLFYDKGRRLKYYHGARTIQGLRAHIEEISGISAIKVGLPANFKIPEPAPKEPLSQNLPFVLSCLFLIGSLLRQLSSLCPCSQFLSNHICFCCCRTRSVLRSVNVASSIMLL